MQKPIAIYVAGPLFTEADVSQRLMEGEYLKYILEENGYCPEECLFNPVSAPFNEKSSAPTAESIFQGDYQQIKKANVMFVDLSNNLDTGTTHELGTVLEMVPKKSLYPIISDIRLAGHIDQGYRSAIGFNQYVVGSLLVHGYKIFPQFKCALKQFCTDFDLTLDWECVDSSFVSTGISAIRARMHTLLGEI